MALGLSPDQLPRNRHGQEKFKVAWPSLCSPPDPQPLGAVLILNDALPAAAESLQWRRGFDAFHPLISQTYRHRAALAMGRAADLYQDAARIAAQTPIGTLLRHRRFAALDDQVRLIEAALEALP